MYIDELVTSTSEQKVLAFLAQHPGESFYDKQVSDRVKLSRGATNMALRELAKHDLVVRDKKGHMVFYQIQSGKASIRQFKVYLNVSSLAPLVEKLKKHSSKVILFGSASKGTDIAQSDMDIFILTNQPDEAREIAEGFKSLRKIQAVIMKPVEWSEKQLKDPTFVTEVGRGIVLWEELA